MAMKIGTSAPLDNVYNCAIIGVLRHNGGAIGRGPGAQPMPQRPVRLNRIMKIAKSSIMPLNAPKQSRIVRSGNAIKVKHSAAMCGYVRLDALLCGFAKTRPSFDPMAELFLRPGWFPPWLPKSVDAVRPLMPGYARLRPCVSRY
jgi:hypothetical protein